MDAVRDIEKLLLWLVNEQISKFPSEEDTPRKFKAAKVVAVRREFDECGDCRLGVELRPCEPDWLDDPWTLLVHVARRDAADAGPETFSLHNASQSAADAAPTWSMSYWKCYDFRKHDFDVDAVSILQTLKKAACGGDGQRLVLQVVPMLAPWPQHVEFDVALPDVCCPEQLDMKMAMAAA